MKTSINDDNDKMTKLMMEVFHLVKKAGITRDLIVRQTHETKRSNSERFTYYDTNIGVLSRNLDAAKKYVDINLYWIETRTMSRSRSLPGPDI